MNSGNRQWLKVACVLSCSLVLLSAGRSAAADEPPGAAPPQVNETESPPRDDPPTIEGDASSAAPAPSDSAAAAPERTRLPAASVSSVPASSTPGPSAPSAAFGPSAAAPAQSQPAATQTTPASAATPVTPPRASDDSSWEVQSGAASEPTDSPRRKGNGKGVFGPLRIGPLFGVGLPGLVSVGGLLKLAGYFGVGVNVGFIPKVQLSYYGDAVLSYREYDVYGRVFPFGSGLFLGAGVGYATAKGTLSNTYDISAYSAQYPQLDLPNEVETDSEGSVKAMVLTPQLGYLHTFASGFTLGVDVGAQIPIAPSKVEYSTRVSSEVPQVLVDQYVTPNDKKVRDTLETIGRTPIPTVNLRVGWLF